MDQDSEQFEELERSLAEGIASIMAAGDEPGEPEDLTFLYLEELNRLWADPAPLMTL